MTVPVDVIRSMFEVVNEIEANPTADAADRKLARAFRSALDTYGREPANGPDELAALREGARLAGVELVYDGRGLKLR